jgi:hypothetical protein
MTKPTRARKRKLETSQGGPGATNLRYSGGQGVHREMESEGHEGKYRAVVNGRHTPEDEPVGLCQEARKRACCTGDEGRSFGVVLQEKTPNNHERLQPKAVVVNVMEKA